MSPTNELQAAVFARLSNHEPFVDLAIVDGVSLPSLPAIRFGAFIEAADAITYADNHVRIAFDLHAFVRETGSSRTRTLLAHINTALRGWRPTLPGMACVDLRYDRQTVMRDGADPAIAHGVISFDALIELQFEALLMIQGDDFGFFALEDDESDDGAFLHLEDAA